MMKKEDVIKEIKESKNEANKHLCFCDEALSAVARLNEVKNLISSVSGISINKINVDGLDFYNYPKVTIEISYVTKNYKCNNEICNSYRKYGGYSGKNQLCGNEEVFTEPFLNFGIAPNCTNCLEHVKEEKSRKLNESILGMIEDKILSKFPSISKYFHITNY
jgi:hypothetical protein